MSLNFLDPNQANQFRQTAVKRGYSDDDINKYVSARQREQQRQIASQQDQMEQVYKAQQQRVGMLELQKKEQELTSPQAAGLDLSADQQKTVDSAKIGLNLLDDLEQRLKTDRSKFGAGSDLLTRAPGAFAKGRKDVKSQINLATQQIATALEGGKLAEGDIKRYREMMPSISDNPDVALRKLQNVRSSLQNQLSVITGQDQQPGLGLSQPAVQDMQQPGLQMQQQNDSPEYLKQGINPAINIAGEIAEPGDLIVDEASNSLVVYGDQSDFDKKVKFKDTGEGGQIDNSFIAFLANSEALPIAGSILGGMAGVGVGSLATGAAGAGVGKAMQQGLRELFTPEKQTLDDMAKAVVIEGATDAVLGAATFAIAPIAGKGLRFVLGKVGKEGVEEVAERGLREGVESTLKETGEKSADDLIKQAIAKTPDEPGRVATRAYQEAFPISKKGFAFERLKPKETAQEMIDLGWKGSSQDIIEKASKFTGKTGKRKGLFNNIVDRVIKNTDQTVKADDVIKNLDTEDLLSKLTFLDEADVAKQANRIKRVEGKGLDRLLDLQRDLQKESMNKFARQFTSQSPKLQEVASLQSELASQIGKYIDDSAGNQLISKFKTPEMIDFVRKNGGEKLAERFAAANSVADMRAIQAPLVRMSQIANLSEETASTQGKKFFGSLLDSVPGLSSILDDVSQKASTNFAIITDSLDKKVTSKMNGNFKKILNNVGKDVSEKTAKNNSSDILKLTRSVFTPEISQIDDALVTGLKKIPAKDQASVFTKLAKMAAAENNKKGLRNLFRVMFKLGATFSADNVAESVAEQGKDDEMGIGSFDPSTQQPSPGLELQQQQQPSQQPGFMYK